MINFFATLYWHNSDEGRPLGLKYTVLNHTGEFEVWRCRDKVGTVQAVCLKRYRLQCDVRTTAQVLSSTGEHWVSFFGHVCGLVTHETPASRQRDTRSHRPSDQGFRVRKVYMLVTQERRFYTCYIRLCYCAPCVAVLQGVTAPKAWTWQQLPFLMLQHWVRW